MIVGLLAPEHDRLASLFRGTFRGLHDGNIASRLLWRDGQRFAMMEMIGEIAMEGIGGRGW